MDQSKAKLELLPQGKFLFTAADGQIHKGRFSMYMLNRFGNDKKANGYFEIIQKITLGMSLEDYADLFLFAFQDYYRDDISQCKWDRNKIMDDFMDELGFTASPDFMSLVKHCIGRLTAFKEQEPGSEEEKKSL